MQNLDIKYFYKWFDNYSKRFYCSNEFINENIRLKREHTKRVCDNANMISNALNLCKKDKDIAEIAALFHDIGRFEQFKRYQTFNDKISENHALLGVRVLNENNILADLDSKTQEYILKAVEYHNMYKMPETKGEKLITFAK
ncbi:MAG: HD domain-containing protein [Clostridium sp.]|nr:HD domain-containing protein [Clostridium sp.]